MGDPHVPVIQPLLLGLGMLLAENAVADPCAPDLAHLREMLHDSQHPRGQNQAALLLVDSTREGAEKAVRDGLRAVESVEVFLALAAAVRLRQDRRFVEELLAALSSGRSAVREAAAQTLAVLDEARLTIRLRQLADDRDSPLAVRQLALRTLGRRGSKEAASILIDHLQDDNELLRRAAAESLKDLSGQNFGTNAARWRSWWQRHQHLSKEQWLENRLAYQTSRAHRLEGELSRSRAQLLRLQQQLYARLSGTERVAHVQSLLDQDDSALRGLAVAWSIELLPTAEPAHKRQLTQVLLRLSQDSAMEVRRAAVLGLGRVADPVVFERLKRLAGTDAAAVRVAALHALGLHARGSGSSGTGVSPVGTRKQVMSIMQKALDAPALEVVVEAAENLGALGAQEAEPVLTGLLRHPSETVRQAAAQALERVADSSVLSNLLDALDDSNATVRFHLVGALAHAAGDAGQLTQKQRDRLLKRVQALLQRDGDPGVRSRAATLLGDCGSPAQLAMLWRCVLAGEDARVQEKAWNALVDILARTGQLSLLQEWDRKLTAERQGPRRLQMLNDILSRWRRPPERKELLVPAQELLVQAQLDLGKWSAAAPLIRDLLTRPANEAELSRRLGWLLTAGQQALHEGNRAEALRAVEAARPFLPRLSKLTESFEQLEKEASRKE
jgi:HEAT repeat protein